MLSCKEEEEGGFYLIQELEQKIRIKWYSYLELLESELAVIIGYFRVR